MSCDFNTGGIQVSLHTIPRALLGPVYMEVGDPR